MSQLFAKIDLDHSKSISFREFRQYIRTIEKNSSGKLTPLNDAELNNIWADFDTNNDKEISVAEFKTKLNEYAPVRVFRHWVRGVKSGKEISIRKKGVPPSMLAALEADLAQVQQDCGHGRYEIRQRMFEFANGRHGFDNIATLEWGENGVKQVQR